MFRQSSCDGSCEVWNADSDVEQATWAWTHKWDLQNGRHSYEFTFRLYENSLQAGVQVSIKVNEDGVFEHVRT
jgi:hypothetical protein